MILLILGLILWLAFHLFRSTMPEQRQALQDRFGNSAKGLMSLGILVSLALMVVGYRAADFIPVWTPPSFFTHINNLLMVFALYVYFMTATKPGTAWIMGGTKNPQLTGFTIWAFAHLLVNGDLASILLFGGLLVWAFLEVKMSKRTVSLVDRSTAPISSPIIHMAVVLVALVVISGIHIWLGVTPFGGG